MANTFRFDPAPRGIPNRETQYCSVGRWTGNEFKKVGEGLCSSQSNPTTKIQTMVLGNKGDLFVGGAFQTRVG